MSDNSIENFDLEQFSCDQQGHPYTELPSDCYGEDKFATPVLQYPSCAYDTSSQADPQGCGGNSGNGPGEYDCLGPEKRGRSRMMFPGPYRVQVSPPVSRNHLFID